MNTRRETKDTTLAGITGYFFAIVIRAANSVVTTLMRGMWQLVARLVCAFLVHLAAAPYQADSALYDPSSEYETAREILAIERLITSRLGSLIGLSRTMRLLGGAESVEGLVFLLAAERQSGSGHDVYLAFELDLGEFSVEVTRTPAESPWAGAERTKFADATTALLDFYSDRAPHPRHA